MSIPITVPRLGWSMDEGTFLGWLKQDGDLVQPGEALFTLEGDKAAQEVEATDRGVLRIPADAPKAGSPVSVGTVLGYLADEAETSPPPPEVPQPETPAPALAPVSHEVEEARRVPEEPVGDNRAATTRAGSVGIAISPRARRRAAELGVDCRGLAGSGRGGRIVEADVLAAAAAASSSVASPMRQTIAQRTAESFSRAPHFYLRTEVDATALLELRERLLPELGRAGSVRLTLTDLLLRAQGRALRDCPGVNAIWQQDRSVQFKSCDVGLVVGLEAGLRIPLVRGADRLSLSDLARERAALVAAARAGTLTPESMQGGATSLSNLGNVGVDEFSAVLSPPQSTMLAVGRAAPRPWVKEGQLVVRTTLILCLSADHRVLDGGPAAQFLGRIVEQLEDPTALAAEFG